MISLAMHMSSKPKFSFSIIASKLTSYMIILNNKLKHNTHNTNLWKYIQKIKSIA